jgi:hypothetical protein
MATIKPAYTSSNAVTITLASLANGSTNTSNALDNSTSLYDDANVQVKVKTGASGVSATGYINVYYLASADGGTTYDSNNRLLFQFPATANATTYVASRRLGEFGIIPGKFWKIAVENRSGAALDATAGNHSLVFEGIQFTSV